MNTSIIQQRLNLELALLEQAYTNNNFRTDFLNNPECYLPEGKSLIANLKMFNELYASDENLREKIQIQPQEAIAELPIAEFFPDPEAFAPMWHNGLKLGIQPLDDFSICQPLLHAYDSFNKIKLKYLSDLKHDETSSGEKAFSTWSEKEKLRAKMELGSHDQKVVHAPFAIELNQGCSVGCWFCGVSAEKLSHKSYFSELEQEWQQICDALYKQLGSRCKKGFLYWATEPMDSPDYEKFQTIFIKSTGYQPQVTTAVGHKHVDRMKAIMREPAGTNVTLHRFSCITTAQLRRVHKLYNQAEQLFVECIAQNKESIFTKANAGKARNSDQLAYQFSTLSEQEQNAILAKISPTIACVTGYLINVVTRTIKLISPCIASDKWPNGYRIYQEVKYQNGTDFAEKLVQIMQVANNYKETETVRFIDNVNVTYLEDGFKISSLYGEFKFVNKRFGPVLKDLVACLKQGSFSFANLIKYISGTHQLPEEQVSQLLTFVYDKGILITQ